MFVKVIQHFKNCQYLQERGQSEQIINDLQQKTDDQVQEKKEGEEAR